MRNAYTIFIGKPEMKRPLGRPRRRWEGNNIVYLKEIVWGCVDWIHLVQERDQWRSLMSGVMNFWLP
jgi:hypothetical protein